jgi:hypothetical protein
MFGDHAPIQNLSKILYNGFDLSFISTITIKCRYLKSFDLTAIFDSWDCIYSHACEELS